MTGFDVNDPTTFLSGCIPYHRNHHQKNQRYKVGLDEDKYRYVLHNEAVQFFDEAFIVFI